MDIDTGTALAAAIRADPEDDAPWLVYADWLQENDRDAEAAAIRAHLPAIQAAVVAGHDPTLVLNVASRYSPGHPAWQAWFGRPIVVPAPAPAPARVTPVRRDTWAGRGEPTGDGTALLARVIFIPCLVILLATLRGQIGRSSRVPEIAPSATYQRPVQTGNGSGDPILVPALPPFPVKAPDPGAAPLPAGAKPWDRAELAGYTFRQMDGRPGERSYAFRGEGFVVLSGRFELADVLLPQNWAVDRVGGLNITNPSGRRIARLVKFSTFRDEYELERDGQRERYARKPTEGTVAP